MFLFELHPFLIGPHWPCAFEHCIGRREPVGTSRALASKTKTKNRQPQRRTLPKFTSCPSMVATVKTWDQRRKRPTPRTHRCHHVRTCCKWQNTNCLSPNQRGVLEPGSGDNRTDTASTTEEDEGETKNEIGPGDKKGQGDKRKVRLRPGRLTPDLS